MIGLVAGIPLLVWALAGESFLKHPPQLKAEVLIVEGWIGIEGVRAAKAEFERGGYRYIVTAGASTDNRWGYQQWNYATIAAELLIRLGVPADRVIEAQAEDTAAQRTFAAASAVRRTFRERGLDIATANVFTRGVHTRRSRLIFAKVLGPDIKVGAICWQPEFYTPGYWWQSTERAEDLLKETVGYLYELLLNSGRTSNRE